jgi:OmpA-OmpF porin, OOP family
MKLFFCLIFPLSILGQNLAPNGDFEEYNHCPSFLGSVKSYNIHTPWGILVHWQANPPDCTPDYFNVCGKPKFRVPKNICGEMPASSGKGYVGMILRIGDIGGQSLHINDLLYREHITAKLTQPLQKNYEYVVQFKVALSEYANYAISHIGALFTQEHIIIQENKLYEPQILYNQEVVKDKKQWVTICDTFVAKGNEAYITIGNFDNFSTKKIQKITDDTRHSKKFNYNRAYYFLDDISVTFTGEIRDTLTPIANQPIFSEFGDLKKNQIIVLKNVFFDFDKADLLPASFVELDKLKNLMYNYPDLKIEIRGHTDSIGTEVKNQLLSDNRAKSVVNYLQQKGVSGSKLFYKGFGENNPIDDNGTEKGRANNRRVEFLIKE